MRIKTIAGIKAEQLAQTYHEFTNLKWIGHRPESYLIVIVSDDENTKGVIICSGAFGGDVSYAQYTGMARAHGREYINFTPEEKLFIRTRYPVLWDIINNLDTIEE